MENLQLNEVPSGHTIVEIQFHRNCFEIFESGFFLIDTNIITENKPMCRSRSYYHYYHHHHQHQNCHTPQILLKLKKFISKNC